ncbi:zinc-binding alcohol dehydrogenase/oxidoreductase [Gracilibacillus orientalis]|uniref:Zinc-binding alcohol dehydrogenase/oxidoreductase n=1 Tax=Gracilibacillus orientalis TaxID=334253 RepID=A0A1I4ME59_9BACI|nr:zinc-binding dehydrogenase [Gracilibacillus orientalis]SFM01548.1 zinc-binding alcohol dehydrogenase/oxidoreductase [Gracilibacillus orientalis]
MKAYVIQNGTYQLVDTPEQQPKGRQVLVHLKTAGLNHRDLNIKDRVGSKAEPYILGSDGAGVIEKTGDEASRLEIGEEVIINPSLNWYDNTEAPPEDFQIVGVPFNGTFAEKILISEDFVERKPTHLNGKEAGVFALSALTGYRALFTQGKIKEGETLFIPGVGGGVTSFIIQMAKAFGARVITTSRDSDKLKQSEKLGYDRGIVTDEDWKIALADEQIDLVIESIGGATFNKSLDVLKKGGRIVTFGSSTNDEFTFNLRSFFYGQYKLIGSTMGSREELHELIPFVEEHNIKPLLDKGYPLDDIDTAFTHLESQKQVGKIYIHM